MAGILEWLDKVKQPDIVGSFYQGQQMAQQRQAQAMALQQAQEQQQDQGTLRSLAGGIASNNIGAVTQAAAIDPNYVRGVQGSVGAANSWIHEAAQGILDAKDPQTQQAIYAGVRDQLNSMRKLHDPNIPDLPAQFDPSMMPAVQAIAAQTQPANDPSGSVQSSYINGAGNRIAIMRDGSIKDLGPADSKTQLYAPQGVQPGIIDMRNGTTTPVQPAGGAPAVGQIGLNAGPMSESEAMRIVWGIENEKGPMPAAQRQQMLNALVNGTPYGPQGGAPTPTATPQASAPSGPLPAGSAAPAKGQDAPSGYQWADASRTTLVPIKGGPADKTQAGMQGMLGDESKTGQAYLDSISDPGLRAYVQGIVKGNNKPENFRTPTGAQITPMQIAIAAARVDPSFSVTDFNTRNETLKSFKDGKDATNVQALNQVAAHLQQLTELAPKLSGMAIPYIGGPLNHLVNAGKDVYSGDLTQWKQVADAVAHETRAVFNNNKGAGTQAELEANLKQLSGDGSTQQKMAALQAIKRLIGSRISIIDQKFQNALGRGNGDSGILPETRQFLGGSQPAQHDIQDLLDKYK